MNRITTTQQIAKIKLIVAILFCLPFFALAQTASEQAIIKNYIQQIKDLSLDATDYEEFEITAQYTDEYSGITHIYLQQTHNGIALSQGTMGLHLDNTDQLAYASNHFIAHKEEHIAALQPNLSATEAISIAMNRSEIEATQALQIIEQSKTANRLTKFAKADLLTHDPTARLEYFLDKSGKLNLCWKVEIYPLDQQHYWVYMIDASRGNILGRTDLVITCSFETPDHVHNHACSHKSQKQKHLSGLPVSNDGFNAPAFSGTNFYRVYDQPIEAPIFGNRSLVGTAGDGNASPLGWHDDGIVEYSITKGNNVYAYHDPGPASTGIPAVGGTPGQQPLVFDFSLDLSQNPALYRDAAVTNLFYWNNLIHDIFYAYGFTEVSGNFQSSNFGHGGEGNDAVLAEAQDGSLVNNANFLTLADGLPGKMQMFLWTSSIPLLDGDLDNGVILHEYGHGISTRLTGGPAATCLGGDEQGGEGWSDFFGYMMTMDPSIVPGVFASGRGIGNYVTAQPAGGPGIRPVPYSTDFSVNSYTYSDITNLEITVPHGVGFIWSTMLWEMTAKLVEAYGWDNDVVNGNGGNNMAVQLVIDGLKLQPCSPTFVEQRDAILAADQLLNGGANHCLIWEAFAKRGLGYSASSGANTLGDEVEAFDMPPSLCLPTVTIASEVDNEVIDGQSFNILIKVANTASTPISGVTVTNTLPSGASFTSSSHAANVNGQLVEFQNLTIPANTTEFITITANTNTGSTAEMLFFDNLEANPFNWTASPGVDQFAWTTSDAFSGNYSFYCADPNNASNFYLTLNNAITVEEGTKIRFAHRYNTEQGFDGALIEGSTDGINWLDLGSAIVENGYNDFVPAANNPLINGFCFGGNSGGFIHSLVDLSQYEGTDLQLRFRFASDVLTAAEGWYIDDIQFVKNPLTINNQASFSMAGGAISDSVEEQILVLGASNLGGGNGTFAQGIKPVTEQVKFTVYPNPASSTVSIQLNNYSEEITKLRLLNVHEQLVQELSIIDNNTTLDVSSLQAGIYFVQIQQNNELQTQRLVIK